MPGLGRGRGVRILLQTDSCLAEAWAAFYLFIIVGLIFSFSESGFPDGRPE